MKVSLRTLALWIALSIAPSGATAAQFPVTVTDDLGRTVTLDDPPERIVAMIPSHTETVCALDACDLLVGVDQFSTYPGEVADLPRLGSGFSPDLEALVALEPDLVLVDEYSGLADALAGLGIPVYAGTPQSFDETYDTFGELGLLLDREAQAALLSGRVEGEIAAAAERVAGAERPTVYYEVDATPYSAGPNSFIGQVISAAGGANIVPEALGDFPQLDPEFVIAADPERVVLADAPFGESVGTLRERPGWGAIDAVESGLVLELTQPEVDLLNRAGPRLGEAVLFLARWLHPDRF